MRICDANVLLRTAAWSSFATAPKEFADLRSAIHPRDEKVLFGAIDPAARPIGLAERFMSLMPAARAALSSGDFRDWPAIDAWADAIARELAEAAAPA